MQKLENEEKILILKDLMSDTDNLQGSIQIHNCQLKEFRTQKGTKEYQNIDKYNAKKV